MTGVVLAFCPTCGDVQCLASEITIRCCVETQQCTCRFRCPKCSLWTAEIVRGGVVAMLLLSGAQLETNRLPLELYERPADAAPISEDDLIDFHQALDRLPTAASDRDL